MNSKPSKESIIRAQERLIPEHIMGCDFDEAHDRCWCCGCKRNTERAHMTPESLGGGNDPDNFVLLCARCHEEAPDVSKEAMLGWLEREHSVFYGDRWARKAMRGAGLFHVKDDDGEKIDRALKSEPEIINAMKENVSTHFGIGLSHGTIVWIIEEIMRASGIPVAGCQEQARRAMIGALCQKEQDDPRRSR